MRTLGTGAKQAAAGNHAHATNTTHYVGTPGEPQFLNGWAQQTNGTNTAPVTFTKLATGLVLLSGNTDPGSNGTACFQLPVGYRPGADKNGFIIYQLGTGELQMGTCNVRADGMVELWKGGAPTFGFNFGLSGVTFIAEQEVRGKGKRSA